MPTNKNALIRYQILDELLSSRYHSYSVKEMTDIVCDKLAERDPNTDGVSVRCIEKDLNFLANDGPFYADIVRESVDAYDHEKQKPYKKQIVKYKEPGYTIFSKKMSDDEMYLLREALSLLGQFDGLPNLEALENLRLKIGASQKSQIVSFAKNPLENENLFGQLFTAISQKQVIELHYHTFSAKDKILTVNLHPYLLKEYNRRWFLFAAAEVDEALLCFSLDRINQVVPLVGHKYVAYDGDINELFDDIIGVTLKKDAKLQKIYFWVSDFSKDYVINKPLHDSQTKIAGTKEEELRASYPSLVGGRFFRIHCKDNYELIRELCSFGKDLIVLEPTEIQDEVFKRISEMNEKYLKLRTKSSL